MDYLCIIEACRLEAFVSTSCCLLPVNMLFHQIRRIISNHPTELSVRATLSHITIWTQYWVLSTAIVNISVVYSVNTVVMRLSANLTFLTQHSAIDFYYYYYFFYFTRNLLQSLEIKDVVTEMVSAVRLLARAWTWWRGRGCHHLRHYEMSEAPFLLRPPRKLQASCHINALVSRRTGNHYLITAAVAQPGMKRNHHLITARYGGEGDTMKN